LEGNGDLLAATRYVPQLPPQFFTTGGSWGPDTINLRHYRIGPRTYPGAVAEYYRHNRWSNALWLDGHVSGIRESLGMDVPYQYYAGSSRGRGFH
jgi:prepilin-type processing-associated H-X9-DG protein